MQAKCPTMSQWDDMYDRLGEIDRAGLLRRQRVIDSPCGPRVTVDGRQVVCLCSNDYLALAGDESMRAAAIEAIEQWGVGAGASRLVSGTTRVHVELERRLAEFKHCQAAVVTTSGWAANHVAVTAMAGKGDLILCDKLNHASIIDAARASGAHLRTYTHRDARRLERLLISHRSDYDRCLIVSDSLFSMDGDFAPLLSLAALKERFDARLLLDEAHATGVFGPTGAGLAELAGVEGRVDATVGTLSKALGCVGGFIAGPAVLADVIRNTARAYIYTTAPPPAMCAAAIRALDIVRDEPQRRQHLLSLAVQLRAGIKGTDTLIAERRSSQVRPGPIKVSVPLIPVPLIPSNSQIIPIILGDASRAVAVSQALLDAGFLVPAIRPPTVAPGTSRLRVSLSAGHTASDVHRFVAALKDALRRVGATCREDGWHLQP